MKDFWFRIILKIALAILIFGAIYALILILLSKVGITQSDIMNFAQSLGAFGVFGLLILTVLAIMSPLPDSPVAMITNILYGPFVGFIIVISGFLLGAVLDFLIFRKLGRTLFKKHFPTGYENANRISKKLGFEALVFFRIFPTFTFDIVSYAAAVTRVKLKTFTAATFLGLIPLVLTYSIIGRGLETGDPKNILISLVVGLGLFSIVVLIYRNYSEKLKLNELEED